MDITQKIDSFLSEAIGLPAFPASIKAKILREAPKKIAEYMKKNPKHDAEEYAFSVVQDMAPYDILELRGGEELVSDCLDKAEELIGG